jgi:Fic family protein
VSGTFEPAFRLTPLMQRQLVAIERTRGFLEAVRLRPIWLGRLHSQARIRDALASVQIEGSSLTIEEAFRLAEDPPDGADATEREFLNYLAAFRAIDPLLGERDYRPTAGDLRNLHRILVDGVRGGQRHAGQFRREEVKVGDRLDGETVVHHQPPPWPEVEDEVEALMAWVERSAEKKTRAAIDRGADDPWVHPVVVAGIAQHRLVWIHPFVDGNGRTARMFTTLLLYYRGYDFKYLFDLSSYYNLDRDKYYNALRHADRTGDHTAWLEYFLGGFAMQMYRIREEARSSAEGLAAPAPAAEDVEG